MKKLLLIILTAMTLILSSCRQGFVEYPNKEDFVDWSGLEPVITNFGGELFGDRNITVDGLYTGYERLDLFGNMIYCKDDGTTIWRDRNNDGLYRLNYKDQKEKICPDEKCRNDIDSECLHLPIFNLLYANGFLYFTYGGAVSQKSMGAFVYRYNIDTYEYEKLIEFQGVTQCELALNGRYLYAHTYNWYESISSTSLNPIIFKVDFNVTRIDLLNETAVVIYSDLKNPDDGDNICGANDFRFINNKIIMPVNNYSAGKDYSIGGKRLYKSMINICTIDMGNIRTLIEFEDEAVRDLYLYGDYIYFMSEKGFCRVNMAAYSEDILKSAQNENKKDALLDAGKREVLNKNINDFCIDGDFLYYTLGDNALYRIKLDYSNELEFNSAVAVYTPGRENYFTNWKVCGDYLYATMVEKDSAGFYRQKINSNQKPYLFYEEQYFNFQEE